MCQGNRVEYRAAEGEGPVPERAWSADRVSQVARVPWNPVRIRPDRWVSLNIPVCPIANEYREGKVKSTPGGE